MARRTARMYYHPYGPDGRWGDETVELQVGDRFSTIAPYSEVMMHMNLAGKPIEVEIVSERAAQIYVDGQQFSVPVTLGEAGIYREGRRKVAEVRWERTETYNNEVTYWTGRHRGYEIYIVQYPDEVGFSINHPDNGTETLYNHDNPVDSVADVKRQAIEYVDILADNGVTMSYPGNAVDFLLRDAARRRTAAPWTEEDAREQEYFEQQNYLAIIDDYASLIEDEGEEYATDWLEGRYPDEAEYVIEDYRKRTARRRTAAEMVVTAGPWEVQIDDDDFDAMADASWGGSTAYAARTLMVNGTPVAVERIDAHYSVVAQSDDEELNPDFRRPMDYSDVEDENDPRVEWDVVEVTYSAIFDRDEQDILEEGDYEYEHPLYTWLPTKDRAMAEANRLAQSWRGASWLHSDISQQTQQVALEAASRYGLPF